MIQKVQYIEKVDTNYKDKNKNRIMNTEQVYISETHSIFVPKTRNNQKSNVTERTK